MKATVRARLAGRMEGRLYYGWLIVGTMFASNLATFSSNASFGLFVTPFEVEFGWSRASIALAPTLGTLFGAAVAPLLGRAVDWFGVRPVMMGVGWFGIGCYLLLGQIGALWQLYVIYAMQFGVLALGGGFLISNVSITRWFVRRRSRAMAIVMMGSSLGALMFITVQGYLIATYGWRIAFMSLAGFVLALVLLPGWLLMENGPERLGLAGHPELRAARRGSARDGPPEAGAPAAAQAAASDAEQDWTLAEAMRAPTFWLVLGGIMMNNFMVAGYFANNVPHMESAGFSRLTASSAWATFFFVGVIAKFIWGFIVEWATVRWSLVLLNLGECLGLFLLVRAQTPGELYAWAAVQGFCHGPWLALSTQVWGDYFGRRHIGRIYGTAQPAIVLGGSMGPWLGGLIYDWRGDYSLFYSILMAMMLVGAGVYVLAKPPVKRAAA